MGLRLRHALTRSGCLPALLCVAAVAHSAPIPAENNPTVPVAALQPSSRDAAMDLALPLTQRVIREDEGFGTYMWVVMPALGEVRRGPACVVQVDWEAGDSLAPLDWEGRESLLRNALAAPSALVRGAPSGARIGDNVMSVGASMSSSSRPRSAISAQF